MNELLAELLPTGSVYAQDWEPVRDAVHLIRLTEAQQRAASFLDNRTLKSLLGNEWLLCSELFERLQGFAPTCRLHFIFHAGHSGSTLLSRLLDQAPGVLGLREPVPLNRLAKIHDTIDEPEELFDRPSLQTRIDMFLSLWRRGFSATRTVVVKATSSSARLAPNLLTTLPTAKAISLNVPVDTYLATYLAKTQLGFELRGQGPERLRRLGRQIGAHGLVMHALSPGELAAMSWLVEKLTQRQICEQFASRVLSLDFEFALTHLSESLQSAFAHLEIAVPSALVESIARGPVLESHAKTPRQRYSADLRAEQLGKARLDHAAEIRIGHNLLERLAKEHAAVSVAVS